MALWPGFVRVEPSTQAVDVIAERGDLAPLALLAPFHHSLLQRDVLGRMPPAPLLVLVEPLTQATEVIAECGDLMPLQLSLLQRGVHVWMPLTPLSVRIEPPA